MQNKVHFKMYKSGKHWVFASLATIAVGATMLQSDLRISADEHPSVQSNAHSTDEKTKITASSDVESIGDVDTSENKSNDTNDKLDTLPIVDENTNNNVNIDDKANVSADNLEKTTNDTTESKATKTEADKDEPLKTSSDSVDSSDSNVAAKNTETKPEAKDEIPENTPSTQSTDDVESASNDKKHTSPRKDISNLVQVTPGGKEQIHLDRMVIYLDANGQLRLDIHATMKGGGLLFTSGELRIKLNKELVQILDLDSFEAIGTSGKREKSANISWDSEREELVLDGAKQLSFGISMAFDGEVTPDATVLLTFEGRRVGKNDLSSSQIVLKDAASFINEFMAISKALESYPSWYPDTKNDLIHQLESADLNTLEKLHQFADDLLGYAQNDAQRELESKTLTPTEREQAQEKINAATDGASLEIVLQEIRAISSENKLKETEKLINSLEALSENNLSFLNDKLTDFLSDFNLDSLTRQESEQISLFLENLQQEAIQLNDKATNSLEDEKKSAIETLKQLDNLTILQEDNFLDQINNAQNTDQLHHILNDAIEQNEKQRQLSELENARREALREIEKLDEIRREFPEEYFEAIEIIKQSNSIDQINRLVEDLKRFNEEVGQLIDFTKNEGIKLITDLENLSSTNKENFIETLNESDSITDILNVILEAIELDEQLRVSKQLEEIKNNALNELNSFEELNSQDLLEFEDAIKQAPTADSVHKIMDDVVVRNEQRKDERLKKLHDAQNKTRQYIDSLSDLSEEEKTILKNEVNAQSNISDIEKIQSDADALNEKNKSERKARELSDAIANGVLEVEMLDFLSETDKEHWIDQIKNAENVPDVRDLVLEAQAENKQKKRELEKQQRLDALKKEGITHLLDLPLFDDSEKQK